MKFPQLAGKRIAILGFGQEGQAALELLASDSAIASLIVLNETTGTANLEILDRHGRQLPMRSGPSVFEQLGQFDVLLKSPGISSYRPEIQRAVAQGCTLTSGTQIWFDAHSNDKIIVVTGTKGKSTTASLLAHLLQQAGISASLIGNIGKPALEQIDLKPKPEVWIVELSSYQTRELSADPSAAILLNLYPEHTDWHLTTENYYDDKTRFIAEMQKGVAILNAQDCNTAEVLNPPKNRRYFNTREGIHITEQHLVDQESVLCAREDIPLQGEHNLKNLCAALTALKTLGYNPTSMLEGVASFQSLPHRLKYLGQRDKVDYIDDSISTTPQSALAALNAYVDQPVTLLVGGYDRDLDWTEFAERAQKTTLQTLITMPESGSKIAAALRSTDVGFEIIETNSLEAAVEAAQTNTPTGGAIILSPGAPSYGRFRNYQERGEMFSELAGLKN